MSVLNHLKKTIEKYIKDPKGDRNAVINIIRHDISQIIANGEDLLQLNAHIPGRKVQYRSIMWSIILGLGHVDEHSCDTYISAYHYLSISDQRKLVEEAQRIASAQKHQKIQTDFQSYCSFLVLLAGFLAHEDAVYPLDQPLLSFGQVFLQHFSYPLAFMAFRQFVLYYAPNCYTKKGVKKDKPSELAVKIAYEYDPSLKKKFASWIPEYSFSFNHVSSFFTQMKEVDQVSIIFDFLFTYGAFMVLFIEAGWMYINRDIKGINETSSLPNAAEVIKRAIIILKNTDPELIEMAKKFYMKH